MTLMTVRSGLRPFKRASEPYFVGRVAPNRLNPVFHKAVRPCCRKILRMTNDETKYQGEQNREDDRCHDREIDTNISVRTLVFYVTWKK